jgi:hypothetical protein
VEVEVRGDLLSEGDGVAEEGRPDHRLGAVDALPAHVDPAKVSVLIDHVDPHEVERSPAKDVRAARRRGRQGLPEGVSGVSSAPARVYPARMRHVWPAIFALVVTLLSSVACYNHSGGAGTIQSFTAERSKVTKGQTVKLTAVFESGTGTIDNGVGEVTSGVPVETAALTGDTTFTLTVADETGSFSQGVEVRAIEPAVITSFKPDRVILPGQSTNLTAVFTGGTGVIDNGIGPVTSGAPVSTGVVAATKNYTLTVTNEAGDAVTSVAEVEAAVTPVISSFTAPGAVVSRYTPTMLTAVFTGGKGVVDQSVGSILNNVPTKTPDVPGQGLTYTLTVTNGLGEKVTRSLTVTTKKELFVADNVMDVLVFDADANGDVVPKRIVVTQAGVTGILGLGILGDELFLSNEGGSPSLTSYNLVDGFRPPYSNGGGDNASKRRIVGAATTIGGAQLFSIAGGELFVADKSSTVKVWNVTDTGNVAPKRTITGGTTGLANCLGTWVDSGELYVGNFNNAGPGTVTVYPQGASGDTAPTRTITGTDNVTGLTVSGNELFVFSKVGEITVFDKMTGTQLRKIAGSNTQDTELYQCSIADGEIFCSSYALDRVVVYPANGDGNIAPTRVLKGDNTFIASPTGAFVF